MKDNKIPVMSKEEREKVWNELKAGDLILKIDWNTWGQRYNVSYMDIVKRTPKGWLRLNNGELLKEFYSDYYIITDEIKEWIRKIELEEDLLTFMNLNIMRNKKEFKENLSYEDAQLLKEIFKRTLKEESEKHFKER